MVGVGVTQNGEEVPITVPVLSFSLTERLPYKPFVVNCVLAPGVPTAVSINVPFVRKTLF